MQPGSLNGAYQSHINGRMMRFKTLLVLDSFFQCYQTRELICIRESHKDESCHVCRVENNWEGYARVICPCTESLIVRCNKIALFD